MNNQFLRIIRYCVLCLDFLSLNALFIFSFLFFQRINDNYDSEYAKFWLFLNGCWAFLTWRGKTYNEEYITSFEVFAKRTMHIYCYWAVAVLLFHFFSKEYELSRFFISTILISQGIMLVLNRLFYLLIRSYLKQRNYMVRKVVIIGYNDIAKRLVSHLEKEDMYTQIVGFCEEDENVKELTNYPIISPISGAMQVSRLHNVNDIYSTIAPEQDSQIYQLIKEADKACIHFNFVPDLTYLIKKPVHINYVADIAVLSMRREPLDNGDNRLKKRIFDIAFSFLVIIFLLSWLMPVIGLLIWLESPGPIFFKQARTGRRIKTFNCFKFRSMRINDHANIRQASKNDDRVTKIGRFLRKTSLDEIPQFFNVFLGQMSIVGPRPHMLKHTDEYSALIDQYMVRQFLKPGITGWAQINGYRGETKNIEQMQGRVEHDIWYMENWSLWLDLKIIFLTAFNIIKGDSNVY